MSGIRARLLDLLAHFDDEAYAALANRGLLRRAHKDLEKQLPTIIEETSDTLTLSSGDHQVRFDARGPAQARCSCPSSGVCQHILAAAIALQRIREAGPDISIAPIEDEQASKADESGPSPRGRGDGVKADAPRERDDVTGPSDAPTLSLPSPKGRGILPSTNLGQTQESKVEPSDSGASSNRSLSGRSDPLERLHLELLAIPAERLRLHCGKAGYRWAWQFARDLDLERDFSLSGERHVVMTLRHPPLSFRYLGGGPEALIVDPAPSQVEKYRVAAILAYRRVHGAEIAPPEPPGKRNASLDFGKDHAPAHSLPDSQAESRRQLREAVSRLIVESVELGLSHLSPGVQERYASLAVWAQGADYHRLARSLRRLADHVELLLERAGSADERRLLDELAIAYALTAALQQAEAAGTAPAHLLGQARSRYQSAGTLELLGLGALPWRSASGYVGLTLLFWCPAQQSFLDCTDARPELLRGFNPLARYLAAGPWGGLGAPQQATGRQVLLTGAQINGQGRISAAESAAAAVRPVTPEAFIQSLPVCSDWSQLRQQHRGRTSLLAEPRPAADWAILEPARFGEARFDPIRQTLVWPIQDGDDRIVLLELGYGGYTATAIAWLEKMDMAALPPGTRIVARLRGGTSQTAEPLSLIRPDTPADGNPVACLYFPPGEAGSESKAPTAAGIPAMAGAQRLPTSLRDLRRWIEHQAERGIPADRIERTGRELEALMAKLRGDGFTAFAESSTSKATAPRMLRQHYLVMSYERLMGETDD